MTTELCRLKYLEYRREYSKRYYMSEHGKEVIRRAKLRLRADLILLLGGCCIRCGYNEDDRALELDHINDDGNIDKKRFRHPQKMYEHYRRNHDEAKRKLQLLCCNCNRIKMYEHNEFVRQNARLDVSYL